MDKWIRLSHDLTRVEAEWMAADVASRMESGAAAVARGPAAGYRTWRTMPKAFVDGDETRGWQGEDAPAGQVVATFSARRWRGVKVAHLDECVKARRVVILSACRIGGEGG